MHTNGELDVGNNRIYGFIALLLASFFFCYWTTIKSLLPVWLNDEDYNYALLIPIITAYLIWERRKQFSNTPISVNWVGGAFLFLFLAISLYGILGSSPSAVRPAIPFVILSVTLFCFGRSVFKILVFPLSLLFFMIPLPTVVHVWIGLPLRSISTKLGAFILRVLGVSAFVEGNIIDLGVTQLQVVDACSGLRFILPLFALSVIFAYFFEKVRWKQFVLAASAIPISIVTNGFRIGVTGILAQYYGSKVAEGFFHAFSGWLVFVFAFVLLFVLHYVMKILFKKKPTDISEDISEAAKPTVSAPKNNVAPVIASSLLLILVGILSFSTASLPRIALANGFSNLPLVLGDWKGHTEVLDQNIMKKSGAEEAFNAVYKKEGESDISLYIGYRGSPFLESENFFHSPDVCIPSSGWNVLYVGTHQISDVANFGVVSVRKMVIEKMGKKGLVYFWFQTKNRTSYNVNINRYHLSLHAIMRDNTYDLFIRPITVLRDGETIEAAEKRMDRFVHEMMPVLLQFLKESQVHG